MMWAGGFSCGGINTVFAKGFDYRCWLLLTHREEEEKKKKISFLGSVLQQLREREANAAS